ncbi:hypothetical protein RRG08_042084 [Elysia crispata]|uniref:Uncharacterized protein n=1 Tax=Elysia crispata TaxID=231223 RepID=A0AAE0Z761_9GAST|nr:hypothetical protein RRG08_042084 [Elysia crispata]
MRLRWSALTGDFWLGNEAIYNLTEARSLAKSVILELLDEGRRTLNVHSRDDSTAPFLRLASLSGQI